MEPRLSLLDGFADDHCRVLARLHFDEMGVEEREGQLTGTRPKTMNRLVSPGSSGELCPLEDLNPAHDGMGRAVACQVVSLEIKKINSSGEGVCESPTRRIWRSVTSGSTVAQAVSITAWISARH